MAEPRLVLLDEPMAGVNPALGRQLVEHVLRLRTETGMTFSSSSTISTSSWRRATA
jgi:ABC-type branched-chain amino acid transport systems, ATPase component